MAFQSSVARQMAVALRKYKFESPACIRLFAVKSFFLYCLRGTANKLKTFFCKIAPIDAMSLLFSLCYLTELCILQKIGNAVFIGCIYVYYDIPWQVNDASFDMKIYFQKFNNSLGISGIFVYILGTVICGCKLVILGKKFIVNKKSW